MTLAAGHLLQGRYRILRALGQGGMGAVYLVEDRRLSGRRCALKEQVPSPLVSPPIRAQLRQQFQAEAHTLAALSHANLPRVIDFFSEKGNDYLVMDYVEGEDLATVLHRQGGPLPETRVQSWATQVLNALDYLHNHHPHAIIHRDIKPANLILTPQGKVVLVDFGLVRRLDPLHPVTVTAMRGMGTPEYTPLEQYGRTSRTDTRSDLYALGATLYHLLTNVPPPSAPQRLTNPAHFHAPRQLNPALSGMMETVILRAMAIYPDDRFQSASEMHTALISPPPTAAGGTPTTQLTTVMSAPPIIAPQGRWGLGGILLLLVLLVLGVWAGRTVSQSSKAATASAISVGALAPISSTPTVATTVIATTPGGPATATEPVTVTAVLPPTSTATRSVPSATATETVSPSTSTAVPPMVTASPTLVALASGSTRVAETDGMTVLFVPAGEFLMGSSDSDSEAAEEEMPQRPVYLDSYWIDQTEVTSTMFARFVAESGYRTDAEQKGNALVSWEAVAGADWQHPFGPTSSLDGRESHPVSQVSWNDAAAYCSWVGRRLPTEAEWEKAARGSDGRRYPWGNGSVDGHLVNFADESLSEDWADESVNDGYQYTAPVGSYDWGVSPHGALDMAGNLWEWTADWYDSGYYNNAPSQNPSGPISGEQRVLRGGSWYNGVKYLRTTARIGIVPREASLDFGFRCAVSE